MPPRELATGGEAAGGGGGGAGARACTAVGNVVAMGRGGAKPDDGECEWLLVGAASPGTAGGQGGAAPTPESAATKGSGLLVGG